MASMRDIKRRKSSISSTQQITKAMKLVSTVKLQHARAEAEKSKPYFECMFQTVHSILSKAGDADHCYLKRGASDKKAVIVITSNRGLAGGYNSNIVKQIIGREGWEREELECFTIGSKGRDALLRAGYHIAQDLSQMAQEPSYREVMDLSERLLKLYSEGEIGEIHMAYTSFKNTVSHVPVLLTLLPVDKAVCEAGAGGDALMNFEPADEEALNMIIPKYVTSLIYGALKEAAASENGARMQAMDNATSNAEEMISDLTLKYNRARQGSITQELTEIISGAEAIS